MPVSVRSDGGYSPFATLSVGAEGRPCQDKLNGFTLLSPYFA